MGAEFYLIGSSSHVERIELAGRTNASRPLKYKEKGAKVYSLFKFFPIPKSRPVYSLLHFRSVLPIAFLPTK